MSKLEEEIAGTNTTSVPGAGSDNSTVVVDKRVNPKNGMKILKRYRITKFKDFIK